MSVAETADCIPVAICVALLPALPNELVLDVALRLIEPSELVADLTVPSKFLNSAVA